MNQRKRKGYSPSFFVRPMVRKEVFMNKEIINKICLAKMAEKITTLSDVTCEPTLEAVLSNLGHLASEITEFGDKKRFIPLNIKETILSLLYDESYIHCSLSHSVDNAFWESEAVVYLHKDDTHPSGEGRFAYTLKKYCEDNNLSEEEGVCSIGNWVRGLAKTRAVQAALPFLNLFCDEDIPKNETGIPQGTLPIPKSPEEKKQEKMKEKENTTKSESSVSANDDAPKTNNSSATSNTEAEDATPVESASPTSVPSNEDTTDSMTLEDAFNVVADAGTCKGHTLREIYEKQPRNIVWLYGKGNSVHKEALLLIINSDPDLKVYLN